MTAQIITMEQVKGRVEVIDSDGTVTDSEDIVVDEVVLEDDKPMANVGIKLGATKNLGDFESLRVDVSLYMPSDTDKKSLNKTFKKCFKWCDNKLDEIINE